MEFKNKKSRLIVLVGGLLAFLIFGGAIYLYYFGFGKSAEFYFLSGFRMPHDAEILVSGDHYPDSLTNEGETFWFFKTNSQVIANYLSYSPWRGVKWRKGPVPSDISLHCDNLPQQYDGFFNSPQTRYLAEDHEPSSPFHDGRVMIIDPNSKKVFYSEWNH